jgi:hypothetical protein
MKVYWGVDVERHALFDLGKGSASIPGRYIFRIKTLIPFG